MVTPPVYLAFRVATLPDIISFAFGTGDCLASHVALQEDAERRSPKDWS
jgi:hypothetical protein